MAAYYIRFYRKILARDEKLLNRARLRILFTCIVAFILLTTVLTLIYLAESRNLLLYRILIFLALFSSSLYTLLSKRPWRLSAHFFLATVTLLIWTNVLLIRQSLYVINIQYALLVIAAGYYILGSRNGLRYGVAAIAPVLGDIIFSDFLNIGIPSRIVNVNYTAYAITVSLNFLLILYIHSLFFKSLNKFKKREALFKHNLELALIQAQEQAMAKTNFLNTMSHEIRTPLNAIVGMSNFLLSGPMLKEQQEDLKVLNFSAQNLMATVNDIIDFNNLDNDKVQLQREPFDLYRTVGNVCNTFREEAAKKSLRFDWLIDDRIKGWPVIGDELRLSQILFHLIGNAVKFTREGAVEVSAGMMTGIENDSIVVDFKVIDSGIGISKAKQQELLDPFKKKLPRTQRQYQATLGLTIAGKLLQLHSSELRIRSAEGKGTTFQFAIHYRRAAPAGLPAESQDMSAANLPALRVLCVDDEQLNLLVVKKTLKKWGIEADEAANGKIAVEMCQMSSYDVILMDINMPIMDGFEASKQIKLQNEAAAAVPRIIALTASVGAAKEKVTNFAYIDDCVLKPFKPEELKAKIFGSAG